MSAPILALVVLAACLAAVKLYDILSGRNFVRDTYDKIRLSRKSVAEWQKHWEENPLRSDIVVCLTTIPSRLPYLDTTLRSLLYQTHAPSKIRLHLPRVSRRENTSYEPPEWLQALSAVEIIRCEDHGPATKLIPALYDEAPSRRLLIVDDDKLYPPDMVAHFDRASIDFPDCALGSSGWLVPADLTDRNVTTLGNFWGIPPARLKATRIRRATEVDIIQGHSGYLVRPDFFDVNQLIADYAAAPPAAFFVDDVWISAYCRAKKLIVPASRFCFVSYRRNRLYDWTSLGRINSAKGDPERNNNTIMIRHLSERWGVNHIGIVSDIGAR